MPSYDEKIRELEKRISETKYNKKTQHAIGLYKAQIAKLREKQESRGKGQKGGDGYAVRKSGDGTVVLLGFPSVGKSSLLNKITNADSPVGSYAFTTLTVIPGLLEHKSAKIQVLDVPGIVQGAAAGTGRGKEVLQVVRNADLIVILLDVFHPEYLDVIKKEVFDVNVRINQRKPDVRVKKTARGGIQIGRTVQTPELEDETIIGILKEFRISNAHVLIRTPIDADQFIDAVEGNRVYVPSITVLNKMDAVSPEELEKLKKRVRPDLCVSAETGTNLENLKDMIFDHMDFIRVYCKEVGKPADMDIPMIMRRGDTVRAMCNKLHRDFVDKFRFVRIWGDSAKFPGQKQSLKHTLLDKDVVELHMR